MSDAEVASVLPAMKRSVKLAIQFKILAVISEQFGLLQAEFKPAVWRKSGDSGSSATPCFGTSCDDQASKTPVGLFSQAMAQW